MERINFSKNYSENLKNRAASQKKGIHSIKHELVKEICDYFQVKEFGLWLGVCRNIGYPELKNRFDYVKERKITNSRYLLASCKK